MHFATSGFITNLDKTKVLMVFHKKLQTWVIPGGHLESNEYPADGACREILEETGVQASIIDSSVFKSVDTLKESAIATPYAMLAEMIPAKGDKESHIHMDFIFIGVANDKAPLAKQEAEVENVKWMTLDEVLKCQTFDTVKKIAQEILDEGGKEKCASLDL